MAKPEDWDAHDAIAQLKLEDWGGRAWRFHRAKYDALDATGSLIVSGRYNHGTDQFPEDQTWPALYLALQAETALGEIVRHVTPELLEKLNNFRLSELDVDLKAVLDCRDATSIGLSEEDLTRDYDFETTQEVASAATSRGAEGILVPSATGLGDNLVVFADRLRDTARLVVVDSREPRLYVAH